MSEPEYTCWGCGKLTTLGVCMGPHEEDDWIIVALITDSVAPTDSREPWIELYERWKLNEAGTLVCEITPYGGVRSAP